MEGIGVKGEGIGCGIGCGGTHRRQMFGLGMIAMVDGELEWQELDCVWEAVEVGSLGTISLPEGRSGVMGCGVVEPVADGLEANAAGGDCCGGCLSSESHLTGRNWASR